MIADAVVENPRRYRAGKHPTLPGDGWIVFRGRHPVHMEPLAYTEAVILAERLEMYYEEMKRWQSETLNPKEHKP